MRLRSTVRWAIACSLAAVAAWLSVRQVRWPALLEVLGNARLALLGLALAIILATTAAKSARWAILLRPCRPRSSPGRLCRVLLIGQMANSLLPRLGDVLRVVLLRPQARGGAPAVLGTLVVEKVLDGALGLAVLLGLGLWTPLPVWMRGPLLGLAVLTGGLLLFLVVASLALSGRGGVGASGWSRACRRAWQGLANHFPWGVGAQLERLLDAFAQGVGSLRTPTQLVWALGLSAMVWVLSVLTNVVTFEALEIEVPGWTSWLVVVAIYAATFLPTVPAQLGVFEYAAVLSLAAAGVAPEPALAFALILHLLVQLPPAVLGPLSMVVEGLDWDRLGAARQEYLEADDARP